MAIDGKWVSREEKTASGRVVKWRERQLKDGSFERIFEGEGFERTSSAQPVSVRAA